MGQSTRMPVTAMLGASVFCSGVTFAATMPYGAIVGIETLGLSNEHYAALVSISSLVGALVTMLIGYASDRLPDRRILVLMTAIAGATGMGLVYFGRSQLAFTIAITVIWPFGFAMFSQNFAYVRVYYNERAPERAHFMITALRTVFSVAWAIVPPVAGYVAAQYSVFDVFLMSALAYLGCGVIFAAMMTDPTTHIAAAPIAKRDANGRRGLLPTPIVAGLVGILIINVAMRLVSLAMPLSIVTRLGGSVGDVGIYAGIAAALEIPFMLMWGYLGRWFTREAIIIGNGLLLGVYILLVSQARSVMDVFLLQAINGIAAAALLSVTISYMQDAIKGRVGLSTSLMDVVGIGATLAGAAVFGVLSAGGNYQLVLVAASGIAIAGGLVMLAGNMKQLRLAPAD
jgi:SET family sugar efflux transporter-like MFS transporter